MKVRIFLPNLIEWAQRHIQIWLLSLVKKPLNLASELSAGLEAVILLKERYWTGAPESSME
jgi:hypothetical protein